MTKRPAGNTRGPLPGQGGRPRKRTKSKSLSRVKPQTVAQANALAAHWQCSQADAVERVIYEASSTL